MNENYAPPKEPSLYEQTEDELGDLMGWKYSVEPERGGHWLIGGSHVGKRPKWCHNPRDSFQLMVWRGISVRFERDSVIAQSNASKIQVFYSEHADMQKATMYAVAIASIDAIKFDRPQ